MTSPVFFTLALVLFYVGVTLTFLNKEDSQAKPLPAVVRVPIQQVAR